MCPSCAGHEFTAAWRGHLLTYFVGVAEMTLPNYTIVLVEVGISD